MTELSDAELVAAYLSGNDAALSTLVNRYLKPIYNFSYRLTGRAEDAEDVAQEAFVKVWKNLNKYDPEKSFGAWLYGIARNTAIDWLRKKRHLDFSAFEREDGSNSLLDTLVDGGASPVQLAVAAEDDAVVSAAMSTLPDNQRRVISLHYGWGFTFAEIGRLLSKSLNTVKSQNLRGLAALRKLLNRAGPSVTGAEESAD